MAVRSRAVGVVDLLMDSRRVVHVHGEPRARRGGGCTMGADARAAHCVGMAVMGGASRVWAAHGRVGTAQC